MRSGRLGNRLAIGIVKQQLPFKESDALHERFGRSLCAGNPFAQIDESIGVPVVRFGKKEGIGNEVAILRERQLGRFSRKLGINRVLADLAEPIFRVRPIGLAAMHDAVPITAGGRVNVLADRVRTVEKIEQQPQAAKAALGHVSFLYRLASEKFFDGQLFEERSGPADDRIGQQRIRLRDRQNLGDGRPIV